jgi:hypothetical protein
MTTTHCARRPAWGGRQEGDEMTTVYLTRYDGLLCATCALNTDDLLDGGTRWLAGLTALSAEEVLAEWPDACCEECHAQVAEDDDAR